MEVHPRPGIGWKTSCAVSNFAQQPGLPFFSGAIAQIFTRGRARDDMGGAGLQSDAP